MTIFQKIYNFLNTFLHMISFRNNPKYEKVNDDDVIDEINDECESIIFNDIKN